MRSRAVILPFECCRSTALSEPACRACSLRLANSSRRCCMTWSAIGGGGYRRESGPAEAGLDSGNRTHPPIPDIPLREFSAVAGQLAGLAHARGAGAWLSASPRVQRLVAAYVALVLGAALTAVAVHQGPERAGEPLALAAASGPVPAREAVVADERAARTGRVAASRTATRRAHQKAAPA